MPSHRANSPVSYVRSSLIFVKPNSRGANKSSNAAAERPSFVSSFSSLSDSSLPPPPPTVLLFQPLTTIETSSTTNHRSATISDSFLYFNSNRKEKNHRGKISNTTRIRSARYYKRDRKNEEKEQTATALPLRRRLARSLFTEHLDRNEGVSNARCYLLTTIHELRT